MTGSLIETPTLGDRTIADDRTRHHAPRARMDGWWPAAARIVPLFRQPPNARRAAEDCIDETAVLMDRSPDPPAAGGTAEEPEGLGGFEVDDTIELCGLLGDPSVSSPLGSGRPENESIAQIPYETAHPSVSSAKGPNWRAVPRGSDPARFPPGLWGVGALFRHGRPSEERGEKGRRSKAVGAKRLGRAYRRMVSRTASLSRSAAD